MASEYYECEAKLSTAMMASGTYFDANVGIVKDEASEITSFSENGNEQNAIGNEFGHILKKEIVEEDPLETKPFSENGMFIDCLENYDKETFYDPDSSELEVTPRNSVEDSKESKFSPTHFWENIECNGLAGELAKPKVNYFHNGVIVKNEDNSECTEESSTNSVEWKIEYDNYEDVKPQIGPNFSHKHSIDTETWPQQNVEEDGIAVDGNNDTRKRSSMKNDLGNSPMIQKLPHCSYPKLYPSETKKGHEIIHMGEKPFQCKVCCKNFVAKNTLLRHERIHTGEKAFQCQICSKSFVAKETMLRHERIHSAEKPFQCKITSRKKTHAQICREYRERKKLQNTMVQNITAERSDECTETDQLQAKKPKTNAERRKKHYEAQKLKKQKSKKIPKTKKQINKEYYERKKKLRGVKGHPDGTKFLSIN